MEGGVRKEWVTLERETGVLSISSRKDRRREQENRVKKTRHKSLCNKWRHLQKMTIDRYVVVETSLYGSALPNTAMPKAQGTLQKPGWKDCRNQRSRAFVVRL